MTTTKSTFEIRQELALEVLGLLNIEISQGREPSAETVATLMSGDDHPMIKDWVKKNTSITSAEYARAMRNHRIRDDLGMVPTCAAELVEAVVRRDKAYCTYAGDIRRTLAPWIDDGQGGRQYITEDDIAMIPEAAIEVRKRFPSKIDREEFGEIIRGISDRHRLNFSDRSVADAVNQWYRQSKRNRKYDLYAEIAGPIQNLDKRAEAEAVWLELAKRCFRTDSTITAEFVVAVLKKFMFQVKRKIFDLPIYDHLMPVLLGAQGKGKSTFVMNMLNPLHDLVKNVNFKDVEEDRNIEVWDFYVLFLDEMGFASKANIDTIKNCITATHLTRRPMRTNAQISVAQNATFIGCSNKELEQLIKDPTGIRRFVALMYSNNPDWAYLNSVDWKTLWTSVDPNGADPMAGFKTALVEVQEEHREMGKIEHWMARFDPKECIRYEADVGRDGWIAAADLYACFRNFEDEFYASPMKTNLQEWGHEMNRIAKNQPDAMRFTKKRATKGMMYRLA